MSMTDPIADMLTRIRNACGSKHRRVDMPASKVKVEIARILKENNFIQDYRTLDTEHAHGKTLRDERAYEFLDRLMSIAIPRIRDFRGLSTRAFDGRGNYTLGVKEQMIFPEINYDMVDKIHGMDITFVTTATRDDQAYALLRELGMPFRGDDKSGARAPQQG